MEKKIYKIILQALGKQTIDLPIGSEILTAQMQGQYICLWYLFECQRKITESRVIEIHGTGNVITLNNDTIKYISTVQTDGLVLHVFENTAK